MTAANIKGEIVFLGGGGGGQYISCGEAELLGEGGSAFRVCVWGGGGGAHDRIEGQATAKSSGLS